MEVARAESVALETIAASIKADGASQTEYMIAEKYIDFLNVAGPAADNKTICIGLRFRFVYSIKYSVQS